MPPTDVYWKNSDELSRITQDVMKHGSKSFHMAACFLPRRSRESARALYAWCRYCDDQIDQAVTDEERRERWFKLKAQTELAMEKSPNEGLPFAFQGFHKVFHFYAVPKEYVDSFLEGMRMDLEKDSYTDLSGLKLYAYRVAGVVGLMMSYVMGVSSRKAFSHACDLGIAMQLTNIARDVEEDRQRGRSYLPKEWLKNSDYRSEEKAVIRLLEEAETGYDSGWEGLQYLSFRAAFAVGCAAMVYRQIGRKLARKLNQGRRLTEVGRIVVPFREKLLIVFLTAFRLFPLLMWRLIAPWKPVAPPVERRQS